MKSLPQLRRALAAAPAKRALRAALDMLAPERCLFCDQLADREMSICEHCESTLVINDRGCPHCALPACAGQHCPRCLADPTAMPRVIAPYEYDPMLAHFLHCWKYNGEWRLARTAAKLMLNDANLQLNTDIFLPTPLHWRRQMRRGFNQSEDLLQSLRQLAPERFGRRRCRAKLHRVRNPPSQAHANERERHRQIRGAFQVSGRFCGESITIIDDVCTTGATALAMTDVLRSAGAGTVTLLCLARTPVHGAPS